MIDYYRMEAVRDLIIGRYDVRPGYVEPVPLPTWNRYPCRTLENCRNDSCNGFVSIYVNTEKVRWLYLEICFFRDRQRAFIRVDCTQMQKLFELGIITAESLQDSIETF